MSTSENIETCERCGEQLTTEAYNQAERDVQATMRVRERLDLPPICAVCLEEEIGESREEDTMYDCADDAAAMQRDSEAV